MSPPKRYLVVIKAFEAIRASKLIAQLDDLAQLVCMSSDKHVNISPLKQHSDNLYGDHSTLLCRSPTI